MDQIRPMSSLIKIHNVCLCDWVILVFIRWELVTYIANGMDADQTVWSGFKVLSYRIRFILGKLKICSRCNNSRVAEFHMRLTFWENLPHRHKGWNRSQIKTKCLYFNFDWVVRSEIGSVISKKGEITLLLQKRELWSTNFESIFCSVKTLFFRKLF